MYYNMITYVLEILNVPRLPLIPSYKLIYRLFNTVYVVMKSNENKKHLTLLENIIQV